MITIRRFADLNIKNLQLLGEGTQGKVYRIDSQRCVKIFKNRKACDDELKTLLMAQTDIHFPRLYAAGENYIIRECINGIELNRYLLQYPLTPKISKSIIELYESMSKVGFTRLDSAIFHIFVLTSGELKLIDTAKSLRKKAIYPSLIIDGLTRLGYKEEFMDYVKTTRPDLNLKWIKSSKSKL